METAMEKNNILIIEDDDLIREFLVDSIKAHFSSNLNIQEASSAQEAIELAKSTVFILSNMKSFKDELKKKTKKKQVFKYFDRK